MTIPGFQDLMLPLLQITGDEQEHSLSALVDALSEHFRLSMEERLEMLPSGRQAKFTNRVGWAQTYLARAKLLERTGRGKYCITPRGLGLLGETLPRIDITILMRYPEFVEFRNSSKSPIQTPEEKETEELAQSPEEILESSYQNLRRTLAQDILESIKNCSSAFFERLVVDLLLAMGYGGSRKDAGQAIGQSGDGGVDGIIKEDRLGLDVIYIQAKRWNDNSIGRPVVQGFAGSLEGHRARKGVFITTSRFSNDAKEYVTHIEKKIVLIDGEQLAQFMIDYGIGVAEIATYTIKRLDLDYFSEE